MLVVANLPAEIAHLLEEIQAKDRVVQECRNTIVARDGSIQKFLKTNGAGQPNPKEEAYAKNIMASFDKAQTIQEEKIGLSEKAAHLVSFLVPLSCKILGCLFAVGVIFHTNSGKARPTN